MVVQLGTKKHSNKHVLKRQSGGSRKVYKLNHKTINLVNRYDDDDYDDYVIMKGGAPKKSSNSRPSRKQRGGSRKLKRRQSGGSKR